VRECLRQASYYRDDLTVSKKCRDQAAVMMRHMQSGVRMLERRQAAHDKARTAVPKPASPAPQPAEAVFNRAEEYAMTYPDRAALIRAHGGMPAKARFDPPEPGLAQEIVASTSPIIRALDEPASA
jgi:hypothetical protein